MQKHASLSKRYILLLGTFKMQFYFIIGSIQVNQRPVRHYSGFL